MKIKHLMIAGCLFTAFTLQSCIKEKDLYQAPPTTYSELNLQLDGDYLSTELPMARATTPTKINESETLVGIAITMTPKEGQNPSSKPYAYGIFQLDKAKDPNNLKIKVIDGYTYRISCSMIANAKDSIIKDEKGFFGAPFDLERSGKIKGECLNKFLTAEQADGIKTGQTYMGSLPWGKIAFCAGLDIMNNALRGLGRYGYQATGRRNRKRL